MEQNNEPEALDLASHFENLVIAFAETEIGYRARAAKELRRLHARVEELEAMLEAPQPQADAQDNLLAALENLLASITGGQKQCGHDFDCVCPEGQARAAIAAAKEKK